MKEDDKKEIKKVSESLKSLEKGLDDINMEKVLIESADASGITAFFKKLASPARWINSLVGIYIISGVTDDEMIRIFSSVTVGAILSTVEEKIIKKAKNSDILKALSKVLTKESKPILNESAGPVSAFASAVIFGLKSEGFTPSQIDEQQMKSIYRIASRNPKLMMMIS